MNEPIKPKKALPKPAPATPAPWFNAPVIDATSALHLGTASEQAAWLQHALTSTAALWKIVVFHQPMFSCARPADNEPLIAAWQPVLEQYGADLVLQGHDHCYSRVSGNGDRTEAAVDREAGGQQGPVYVVSVAGSKMNTLDQTSLSRADRSGDAAQLFQVIDVTEDRLAFRAFTASGTLFDSFNLVRSDDGTKLLEDHALSSSGR